ncbi:MAG: ATP-binding cassette domain-containing protein [Treponema sp.]|jgi:ATPase subunit of ABC transporter with duplicated ATPase domains|nr:ATP-binding cassette domain-containing protein [Treponema sp.]
MACFLSFNNVSFSYPSSIKPVLENINAQFPLGWTGISGDNGAGKTTLLLLAAGLETPSAGSIRGDGGIYCPQRTDYPPGSWEDFFYSGDPDADRLMNRLRINAGFMGRWDTASHGERKRVQLGIALWKNPPLLAVDEPTNHLDRDGRDLIAANLEEYRGIGLLVSHDRALLDRLCGNCLFIHGGSAVMRPGGISQGMAEEEREALAGRRRRQTLVYERGRLAAEADSRRRLAESAKNRLSKKQVDPNDRDAKGKINLAKLSGKDASGTRLYKNMQNRVNRIDRTLEKTQATGEQKKGLTLRGAKARADFLWHSPAGEISLGEGRSLRFPELIILPQSRIALTGPNGAGKSTLIRRILAELPPHLDTLYLPQEIPVEEGLLQEIQKQDEKTRGEIIARFSRLGSAPASLLQSALPSPGEARKLMIACGVLTNPSLIIMDEPTNHLDLTSIRLLEEMLIKEVEAALFLVSHDDLFLSRLTNQEWSINAEGILRIQ